MGIFRRPPDDDDSEAMHILPIDDAAVFDIRERQKRIRESGVAHTRRMMEKVWNTMQSRWQWERDRYDWIDERTGQVIRGKRIP